MTTSGTSSYNPTRDEIVNGALRLINAYSTGMSPTPDQLSNAHSALNLLLKSWMILNGLWLKVFVEIPLIKDQVIYEIPGCFGGEGLKKTVTTVAASSGDTSITVSTPTNFTTSHSIAIVQDDDTLLTTTVSGVTGSVVSLASALTDDVASGNAVFSVLTANSVKRPTRIFEQSIRSLSGTDTPIDDISRADYSKIPTKTSTGQVNQIYYDPQLVTGKLYVWPAPSDTGKRLYLTIDRVIQDITAQEQTYDIPQEWVECLKYRLATRLAPEYSVTIPERRELREEYAILIAGLVADNIEHTPTFFGYDGSA